VSKLRAIPLLLAAALAFGAVPARAQRMPVPIVNHADVPVLRAGGQPATLEDVRKAILAAADATGRHWVITEPTPGRMLATYHVRTHTVVTEIRYSPASFSVAYSDSSNMKYSPGGPSGTGVIHPFYNQWVQDFVRAIQLELARVN
jgi:hypothetical protein